MRFNCNLFTTVKEQKIKYLWIFPLLAITILFLIEFLSTAKDIFLSFHDKGRRSSTGSITSRPVVVPTSETEQNEEDNKPQESTSLNLPIESTLYLSTLLSIVEKLKSDVLVLKK